MKKGNKKIEQIEENFKKQYEKKKRLNLLISLIVVILGIFSVIYIWNYDKEGILTFRWMTVDGTIYTSVMAFAFIVISLVELKKYTEVTSKRLYFMRLSSAVAESLIIVVVLLSQLPMSPTHMHILRPDMFCMHIIIPILTVVSFVVNDSPVGRLGKLKRLNGLWFVTFYAIVMTALILEGVIADEEVPYFFLDIQNMPALRAVECYVVLYAMAYTLTCILYRLNKKLSWMWFRGVTG